MVKQRVISKAIRPGSAKLRLFVNEAPAEKLPSLAKPRKPDHLEYLESKTVDKEKKAALKRKFKKKLRQNSMMQGTGPRPSARTNFDKERVRFS